jgi:hypothetical protein
MMMTIEQRMAQLEARCAQLEGRIAALEARGMTYGPIPTIPSFPIGPTYPHDPTMPPYTITCKMADGTTKEMTFTTPIVVQTNK